MPAKRPTSRMRGLSGTVAALALAAGLAPMEPSSAQELSFRTATETTTAAYDTYVLLKEFAEEAAKRSDGAIKIEVFAGGVLGNHSQLQEQVQLGTIETIGTGSTMVELEPKFGVFDLPFLFKDRDHAYRAMDGALGEALAEILLENRGVRVLAYGEIGFRHVTNASRPINTPGDLEGLKIRVPSNKMRIAAFKALGATPTPIPYKELYSALQQGVVDGQENPVTTVVEFSLWDVQKYISKTSHVFTPTYILANEKWWQSLTEEQRSILSEAAEAAEKAQRELIAGVLSDLEKQALSHGMEVNMPELGLFVDKTRPVWAEFEERHGSELIDMVLELR